MVGCAAQTSQSACHGQTRTLPFAVRADVGTIEETCGWKEPARRPSKAPWVGMHGAEAVRRRQGFPEGLVHTGLVQWAAPTRSRTISAVIRPAREDGGEAGRGGSGVGANQPSGWITRSDHAARRPHSCRRLPQFHQLETPGKATGRGGQGRAGRACKCNAMWDCSRKLRCPHRPRHVCNGLEKITQI